MIKSEQTKKMRIIKAGGSVFAQKGYHAVKVEDILRAAGVSRATFYAHFANKEDLFSIIVDMLLQEQSSYILDLQKRFLSNPEDLAGTLQSIMDTVAAEALRNKEALRIFFDVVLGSGTRAEDRFRQMQRVTVDHFTKMGRQVLQEQGYSPAASRSLAYLLIGGFSYVTKLILYDEMNPDEIAEVIKGMKELLSNQSDPPHRKSGSGLLKNGR